MATPSGQIPADQSPVSEVAAPGQEPAEVIAETPPASPSAQPVVVPEETRPDSTTLAEPVPVVPENPETPEVPENPEPVVSPPVQPSPPPESAQISSPSPVPEPLPPSLIPPPSQPPPSPNPAPVSSGCSVPQMISVLKSQLDQKRVLANLARTKQKEDRLAKILSFVESHGSVNNPSVRDLLHISQSSATGYLKLLVSRGNLVMVKKSNFTHYIKVT